MNTLTIPEIFSNIDFYKENYLSILANTEKYYTHVADAFIQVWPVGTIELYLGDLLQLWFSEKWLINSPCQLLLENYTQGRKQAIQRDHDLYLYQLSGSALSGINNSKVWSVSESKPLSLLLDSVFKYYCIYRGTERPELNQQQLIEVLKTAI
ncbi:hypothetical protein [Acinetobacter sp. ANC 4648]|uniref:hypothetical protein n=1 Tax=Acinetobacter sp. ANC 4648 TaxID=1977875 RepID=UPI000A3526A3|nr:hypothetical protein [Acinetobacter sp. ANC 4648]OTG81572.1 hypothetical protein B9T27_09855 [Acinetobacter sp. ANC 4648]